MPPGVMLEVETLLALTPTMRPEDLAIPFTLCALLAALFAVMHRCSRLAGKNQAWKDVRSATQSNTRALQRIDESLAAMADGLHRVKQLERLLQEALATQEKMLAAQKQTLDVVAKSGRALEHANASLTSLADGLQNVDATLDTLALSFAGRVDDAPRSWTDHEAGAPPERPRMKALSARRVPANQATSGATTADSAAARASARASARGRTEGGGPAAAVLPQASSIEKDNATSFQVPLQASSFAESTGIEDSQLDWRPKAGALPDKPAPSSIARYDDGDIASSTPCRRDNAIGPVPRAPPRHHPRRSSPSPARPISNARESKRRAMTSAWRSDQTVGSNSNMKPTSLSQIASASAPPEHRPRTNSAGPLQIASASAPPKHRRRTDSAGSAKPISSSRTKEVKFYLSSGSLFYANVVEKQAKRDALLSRCASPPRSSPPRSPPCSPMVAAFGSLTQWARS